MLVTFKQIIMVVTSKYFLFRLLQHKLKWNNISTFSPFRREFFFIFKNDVSEGCYVTAKATTNITTSEEKRGKSKIKTFAILFFCFCKSYFFKDLMEFPWMKSNLFREDPLPGISAEKYNTTKWKKNLIIINTS
jgi:hypothetical protein